MKVHSILLVASSLVLGACSGGGGGGSGGGGGGGGGTIESTRLVLSATDAPFVHDIVASATITVDRISISTSANSDNGALVLHEGEPITMVLTDLVDGVTQSLGEHELAPGTYRQIRLRVSHASLELVNGNVYSTDDDTIHLSSQGTSGFKVFLDPPLVLEEGVTAGMLLDIDLTRTFHPIPANDPENANRFNLHPVIRAADLALTGGIQGTVSEDDGQGGTAPVESATVYVLPPGVTDVDQAVATSATGADGHYTILGLLAGSYDVLATKDGREASATGIAVEAGPPAVVDLVLPAPPTTGGISGVVRQDDGTGNLVAVAGANVLVLPPGVVDPLQAVATTVTASDGTYGFAGILTGTYDVRAELLPAVGTAAGIAVAADAVTLLDLVIQ